MQHYYYDDVCRTFIYDPITTSICAVHKVCENHCPISNLHPFCCTTEWLPADGNESIYPTVEEREVVRSSARIRLNEEEDSDNGESVRPLFTALFRRRNRVAGSPVRRPITDSPPCYFRV